MKSVRNANFSGTWYPGNDIEVRKQLEKWNKKLPSFNKTIISGVVPHAGWFFSGMIAYDLIRRFDPDIEIIIVIGGHLPEDHRILYYDEDFLETPCGKLSVEKNYIDSISSILPSQYDNKADNTIEVQLPIIKALFNNVKIVPLRVPSGNSSLKLIDIIDRISKEKKQKIAVLGSTDLTHYGSNYNFHPEDSMENPLKWVEKSDRKILQAMIEMNPNKVLDEARKNQSACSAGAAACATAYASLKGIQKGHLLTYDTSYSKHVAESFVGYGAVAYEF